MQTAEVRGRGRQVPRSVVARAAVRRAVEDAPAQGAWVLGGGERGGEPGASGWRVAVAAGKGLREFETGR